MLNLCCYLLSDHIKLTSMDHSLDSPLCCIVYRCKTLGSSYFPRVLHHGVAQWVARLTRNVEVVGQSPLKGPRCFLEQETLPLLLNTGWFQERIRA